MDPIGEARIRASFVNCSKGEARRLGLPRALDELPWGELDFLGWRDPGAPERGYLVAPREDGELVGVVLRVASARRRSLVKTNMCSVCVTTHAGSGVDLVAAPRAGSAGREGNTVGTYMCADLACSLYIRGLKRPNLLVRHEETLALDDRVARLRANLDAFVDQVLGD
jgi:hypothetical protein